MYSTLEVENKFRKARLITNPQERTNMQGAKPNVQIVKDTIYNWNNTKELYTKYNQSTVSNVRCAVRAIIKQYINSGEWAPVPYTMPYNTKGAVCVIQEGYDYLADLFDNNIAKIFEKRKGPHKTKKTKQLLKTVEQTQPTKPFLELTEPIVTEPIVMIDTRVDDTLRKEISVLLGDINKYSLTKEQIVEQLEKLKRGADD